MFAARPTRQPLNVKGEAVAAGEVQVMADHDAAQPGLVGDDLPFAVARHRNQR
jgi:hypothetical protein